MATNPVNDDIDMAEMADQWKRVQQRAGPLVFEMPVFDAWTLVACLQFATRNPQLSATQRGIAVGFARQMAEQIKVRAREVLGPNNLLAVVLDRGFEAKYDEPRGSRRG